MRSKNSIIIKLATISLGLVLGGGQELLVNAGTELTEKTGYHIDYHLNHNYTEYGQFSDTGLYNTCDNYSADSTSRQCIQVLNPIIVTDHIFNAKYKYKISYVQSVAPTSADDPRWETCLEEYGCYIMPLDNAQGAAVLCTDNTVWILQPEAAWLKYDGSGYGTCAEALNSDGDGYVDVGRPSSTASNDIHIRLYYVNPIVSGCNNENNYKFLKNVGYFYYADGNDGDGWYFSGVYRSRNFTGSIVYWDNDDFRRFFAGTDILATWEQNRVNGVAPSYALCRYDLTSSGTFTRMLDSSSVTWDSSGNAIFISNATGGYKLNGHDERLYRYICNGHYAANTYTIKYDLNTGSGTTPSDQTATYDSNINLASKPSDLTKTGYTFEGWYSPETQSNYTTNQTVKNLTTVNNGTITMKAIWSAITYQVEYKRGLTNIE
jgi:uncharacterized repeat protein (TIGR02543 family)